MVDSGSVSPDLSSGSGIVDSGANVSSDVSLPDIVFSLQHWSYLQESDTSLDNFTCESDHDCKVNFTLELSFTGAFQESDYLCSIDF